mgnify:FL=1
MSTSASADPTPLLQEARSLMATGRVDEALGLFRSIVEAEPRHVEARNALAVAALRAGDLVAARDQLDAALAVAPDDALTLNHLAQLQQAQGDVPAALQTYAALLQRQPTLYTVRLAHARLLEATGDVALAAREAFRAIRQAQRAGRWLSAESTAPGLREPVTRAMALVDRHRQELCERIFSPLVQRFGPEAMARVAGFVALQLGQGRYTPADARQHPTAMPFPGLSQSPYIEKHRLDGLAALEAQTPEILAELQAVLGQDAGRESVFDDPALAREFLRSPRGPASWDGYYFYRHGQRNDTNALRCPRTLAAVDRLALARVPGHGPEVLFSALGPGTHLQPHHGVTNTRLVCHLPLIVPPDCALRVAGEEHAWRVGEVVVFDDTYSHEAWNRSDELRVVMIFDMWHPELSEAERVAVCELQAALGDFAGHAAHGGAG